MSKEKPVVGDMILITRDKEAMEELYGYSGGLQKCMITTVQGVNMIGSCYCDHDGPLNNDTACRSSCWISINYFKILKRRR